PANGAERHDTAPDVGSEALGCGSRRAKGGGGSVYPRRPGDAGLSSICLAPAFKRHIVSRCRCGFPAVARIRATGGRRGRNWKHLTSLPLRRQAGGTEGRPPPLTGCLGLVGWTPAWLREG